MPWIESHTTLKRSRKVRRSAAALRIKAVYFLGHLHGLWHDALELQPDGDLSDWTDEEIAAACDYGGDAPTFVRLLQNFGWLDKKMIHDWLDYTGRYLESKYRTSKPQLLVEIWQKHGRVWGGAVSLSKNNLPTNPPTNPTVPPATPGLSLQGEPFDRFWAAYPKHRAKQAARKAWNKLKPDEILVSVMLKSLEAQRQQIDWQKEDGHFIPLPATWLNGRRWEDELEDGHGGGNGKSSAYDTLTERGPAGGRAAGVASPAAARG